MPTEKSPVTYEELDDLHKIKQQKTQQVFR